MVELDILLFSDKNSDSISIKWKPEWNNFPYPYLYGWFSLLIKSTGIFNTPSEWYISKLKSKKEELSDISELRNIDIFLVDVCVIFIKIIDLYIYKFIS